MGSIGLVIVSHSKHIAQGLVELIGEVAKDVPITYVGGTEDGGIGTSFDQVDRLFLKIQQILYLPFLT